MKSLHNAINVLRKGWIRFSPLLRKGEEARDDESSKLLIRRGVKCVEWNETRGIGFAFDQPCNE